MKNFIKTAALILVATAVSLIVCEVFIRIAVPQRLDANVAVYEPDDDLVFKLKRNFRGVHSNFEFQYEIVTNSIGLRDREIEPKRQGTVRILGLGDSFSYANGVPLEDTYFKRLERLLVDHALADEIINCAVPANSLIQEIRYLKRDGIHLQPDAVIVGFYAGNDFTDSFELFDATGKPGVHVTADGWLVGKREVDEEKNPIRRWTAPIRRFAQTRSHLYIFVRNRTSELLTNFGLRAPIPTAEFCEKEYSPLMQQGWEVTQHLLLELASYTRQEGISLYIVILPTIYQVYPQVWDQYVKIQKINPLHYDLDKPQRILSEFCRENGINCVDVLPALRRAGVHEQLYFPVDSHMSPEGHRVVADSLCAYFLSRMQ